MPAVWQTGQAIGCGQNRELLFGRPAQEILGQSIRLKVTQEFEHLLARLRGLLSSTFKEDGTFIISAATSVIPIGGLLPYAGTDVPDGYLACDGAAVSRTTYVDLFHVIGTAYGTGNGTTTFNVPDLTAETLDYLIYTGLPVES